MCPSQSRNIAHGIGSAPVCCSCMDEGTPENPIRVQCGCDNRPAHKMCLARWQLQRVGTYEEHSCRFCSQKSAPWCGALLPEDLPPIDATAIIAVAFGDKVHKIPVSPGPEGEAMFTATVRSLFGFTADVEFDVSFEVKLPQIPGHALPATTSNSALMLRGMDYFTQAATCARASAIARHMTQKK